jgi:hypothetical protein
MYLKIFFVVSKTYCLGLSLHRCSSDVPLNSITLKISAEGITFFSVEKFSTNYGFYERILFRTT